MNSANWIKFGIHDDFSISFGTGTITSVVQLNYREWIISTTKEIIKLEKNYVKMKHPIKFSSCIVVPDTDFLIGVTVNKAELVIYDLTTFPQTITSYNSRSPNLPTPLLDHFEIDQSSVFHLIYSPKSQSIISIGAGIKVFSFTYKLGRLSVVPPTVSIKKRSSFASNYTTTILVPPAFDPETELILLPTQDGIAAYNLDGHKIGLCSRYPTSLKTVYATHPSKPPKVTEIPDSSSRSILSKKLLTYDSSQGMVLWNKRGRFVEQFTTIGTAVLAIIFIDSENAICLSTTFAFFIFNIKTGKTFFCSSFDKMLSRIFLVNYNNEPYICACFNTFMVALKPVIPWRVWNLNVDNALSISRCNRFNEAARVLIETENSFIKLYSPRNGHKMTVATPSQAVHPISFLYDRGIFETYSFHEDTCSYMVNVIEITNENNNETIFQENESDSKKNSARDILFFILKDGTILGFDSNSQPCEELMRKQTKAAFITICRLKSKHDDTYKWCYAIASENSDLFILDYYSLKELCHFTVVDEELLRIFYHYESGCMVMVFAKKTILYDIENGKIADLINVGGNRVTALFADFVTYGYESGYLLRVFIRNKKFIISEEDKAILSVANGNTNNMLLQKPHNGKVTGFSFSQKIWLSSGLDGNVIVWDYHFEKNYQITLPLPLRSCLVMNGKREILVATDTEVMQIKSHYLLDIASYNEIDQLDVEIEEIDNFDRLQDILSHDTADPFDGDAFGAIDDLDDADLDEYYDDVEENENDKNQNSSENKFYYKKSNEATDTFKDEIEDKTKKKNNEEESEESKLKKFEMMQAMNGLGPTPPSLSTNTNENDGKNGKDQNETNEKENDEEEDDDKDDEPNDKKKKKAKEAMNLNDFINNNIEQEKNSMRRKRVKKPQKPDNSNQAAISNKKSEAEVSQMIGDFFNRDQKKIPANKGKDSKKKAGEGIDFNELAKKFKKTDDQVKLNFDKTDLNHRNKNGSDGDYDDYADSENDENDDDDDDDYDDDENGKKKSKKSGNKNGSNHPITKPKDSSSSPRRKGIQKNSVSKNGNSDQANEKGNHKISIGTQPDDTSNQEGFSNIKIKMNGKRPNTNDDEIDDDHTNGGHKGRSSSKRKRTNSPNNGTSDGDDDNNKGRGHKKKGKKGGKWKNKGDVNGINSSNRNQNGDENDSRKNKYEDFDDLHGRHHRNGCDDDINLKNKENGELSDAVRRSPTPPIVRSNNRLYHLGSAVRHRFRPRTPPLKKSAPMYPFQMPAPNIVIDEDAVLALYGRGRVEFKPLVDLIQRNKLIQSGFSLQTPRLLIVEKIANDDVIRDVPENTKTVYSHAFSGVSVVRHSYSARTSRREVNEDEDENAINTLISNRPGFSKTLRSNSTRGNRSEYGIGVRPNCLPRLMEVSKHFSPSAYVYNYSSNKASYFHGTDEQFNKRKTNGSANFFGMQVVDSLKTPKSSHEIMITSVPEARSPRNYNRPQPFLEIPQPVTPVMISPHRNYVKRQNMTRHSLSHSEAATDNEDEKDDLISDKLATAVMSKMPKLDLSNRTPTHNNAKSFAQTTSPKRPNSTRTNCRNPLAFTLKDRMQTPRRNRNNNVFSSTPLSSPANHNDRNNLPLIHH